MSDNYTDPLDDDDADPADDFKNLRAKAKKADRLEPEVVALRKELAFVKAGIPMEDPKMSYFVKGYEGELDPSAIKQAAIEAGFIAAPTQEPDPAVVNAQQGQSRVVAAASESQPSFDESSRVHEMQQAYAQGGLGGLSAVTEKYGVTFNPTPI